MRHRLRTRNAPAGPRDNGRRLAGDKLVMRGIVHGLSVRQDGDDLVVGGYGLKWDDVYDAGWFTESFREGAFVEPLDDVRLLVGHDRSRPPLARSPKTMQLEQTDVGLALEATLDARSPEAMSLYVAVDRGDIDQMSVGFWPVREEVTRYEDDTPTHYEVVEAELVEVSAVPWAAYESSELEPRESGLVAPNPDRRHILEVAERRLQLLDIGHNGG